ncbi:hypothetical protein ACF1AE_18710 [Streptomyces sp. NPDC014986]
MMRPAAARDELVSSARARRPFGRRPRHASFTDDPERHHRAWRAGRPTA